MPYWESHNGETTLTIYQGHVLDILRGMPSESVHCAVTSPPYFGLRDYKLEPLVWGGDAGCEHDWGRGLTASRRAGPTDTLPPKQRSNIGAAETAGDGVLSQGAFCLRCGAWRGHLGFEPTPDLYVQHLVEVFREVRRVLRRDGALWLNMGDSYASNPGDRNKVGGFQANSSPERASAEGAMAHLKRGPGIKPKDLLMMPARVALALQADGWWLRSDIIWSKPNPMPEPVTDRPTKAHEYLFLLAKSQTYFYDSDAIREPHTVSSVARVNQASFWSQSGGPKGYGEESNRSARKGPENLARRLRSKTMEDPHAGGRRQAPEPGEPNAFHPAGRNKRSVWEIATEPFREAHFAVFPQKLVEPCILAGTSEKGCCPACGAPWERIVEAEGGTIGADWNQHARGEADFAIGHTKRREPTNGTYRRIERGWRPTCACQFNRSPHPPVPCTVLDPFLGSGTVLLVAQRLGRNGVGIELNPDYCQMAVRRLGATHAQQRLPMEPPVVVEP